MNAAGHNPNAITEGTVVGAPRRWLRLEAAALLTAAAIAYTTTHQPWWLIPAAFLVPDLSAFGYLRGPRQGARAYNVVHATPLPAILIGVAWTQHQQLLGALGLIWLMHIAFDRLLGFGLKYPDDFQHTHLSQPTR
jgi:hypothetical protein